MPGTMTWTADELASIPQTGAAWTQFVTDTNTAAGTPDLANQDSFVASHLYAQAIRWAIDGGGVGQTAIIDKLKLYPAVLGTGLGVFRQMAPLVCAADLVDMDPTTSVTDYNSSPIQWGAWVEAMILRVVPPNGRWTHIRKTAYGYTGSGASYSNWGAWARAAFMACAFYTGNVTYQAEAIAALRQAFGLDSGLTGYDPTSEYNATWVPGGVFPNSPNNRYMIVPTRFGAPYAGIIFEDAARGGGAPVLGAGPPSAGSDDPRDGVSYSLESWEGLTAAAVIASHCGYSDMFTEGDNAPSRAMARILVDGNINDTAYGQYTLYRNYPYIRNQIYGTSDPVMSPTVPARFFRNADALTATGSTWLQGGAEFATGSVYASAHLSGNFTNPANAVGNTPATWAGDLNDSSNRTSRWSLDDPELGLLPHGIQIINVTARKGSDSHNPSIYVNLYDNAVFVRRIIGETFITSQVGQTLEGWFDSNEISDRANAEIQVVMTAAGSQLFADNFNRADGALGANWVQSAAGTFTVAGNAAAVLGAFGGVARWVTSCDSDLTFAEVKQTGTPSGVSVFVGPAVCIPAIVNGGLASQGDYYQMQLSGAALNILTISRKNNLSSGSTTMKSATWATVLGDVLRLESTATDVIGYVNGVERLRAEKSAAPLTVGGRGVGFVSATANVSIRIDDWSGGDI